MSHFEREPEPPWMRELRLAEGVHEVYGPESHPVIAEMHAALGPGVESDEVAWCSAAVAWSFRQCGMLVPEGVTRAARSWLHGKDLVTLQAPCRGAIAVLWRESRTSWKGHVGLVTALSARAPVSGLRFVTLLGGNQRNSVSLEGYGENRVLGYMWPRNFDPEAFPL